MRRPDLPRSNLHVTLSLFVATSVAAAGGACSSGGAGGGSGGAKAGSGGMPGSGGGSGTGGATTSTGGSGPGGSGGSSASGGAGNSSGGAGGSPGATGGSGAGGGTDGSGGTAGGPGAGGGIGGAAGGGGRAAGGAGGLGAGGGAGIAGTGGAGGAPTGRDAMTFFVTSRGMGNGGNLNGLDGADAFCKQLAMAVSPALGAKTWRAYLSTTTVDARDRIGPGPWRNAAGVIIANTVAQLHDPAMLNSTWPMNDPSIALDQTGAQVPTNPVLHDILTGTNPDGTAAANHCSGWTSTTGMAQNGHSNRSGGGQMPTSWVAAHTVGCGEPTNGMNFQSGTVSSGGGRGSFYCFALP